MKLFYFLISWVLLQITPFIRDLATLPLHQSRSLDIDLFLLLFSGLILVLNIQKSRAVSQVNMSEAVKVSASLPSSQKSINNSINLTRFVANTVGHLIPFKSNLKATRATTLSLLKAVRVKFFVLWWSVPLVLFYITSKKNESEQLFYLKQYSIFFIILFFVSLLNREQVRNLIKSIYNNSLIFFMLFFGIYMAIRFGGGLSDDLISKNAMPIFLLLMAVVCESFNEERRRRGFLVMAIIVAAIASSKLFFLLLGVYFILNTCRRFKFKNLLQVLAWPLNFYFILLIPIFIPYVLYFIFDVSFIDFLLLEDRRSALDNNIASLISRIYSIPFMFQSPDAITVFGHGEGSMGEVGFWGYPVHNVLAAVLYSNGFFIIIFFGFLFFSAFKYFRRHLMLGVITASGIIYFNDIYPFFALVFLPYSVRSEAGVTDLAFSRQATPLKRLP